MAIKNIFNKEQTGGRDLKKIPYNENHWYKPNKLNHLSCFIYNLANGDHCYNEHLKGV